MKDNITRDNLFVVGVASTVAIEVLELLAMRGNIPYNIQDEDIDSKFMVNSITNNLVNLLGGNKDAS